MSDTALQRAPGFFRTPQRCRQKYEEAWSIGKVVYDEWVRLKKEREIELAEAEATAYARADTAICNAFLADHSQMRRQGAFRARRVVKDLMKAATARVQALRGKLARGTALSGIAGADVDADPDGIGGYGG